MNDPVYPQQLTDALLDLQDARNAANRTSMSGNRMAAMRQLNAAIQHVLEVAEEVRRAAEETEYADAHPEEGK
jgi:hypothetical protein